MLDLDALVLGPCFAAFGESNRGYRLPFYAPQAGAGFAVEGVFRIPSFDVLRHGDEPGLTTRKPELDLRLSQLPSGMAPVQRDRVAVRGILYTVVDVRPDGNGLVTLELAESPDSPLPATPYLPMAFVGGFALFTDAAADLVIQAPDGTLSVIVKNSGAAPLTGTLAPPDGVQLGIYALYQDDAGDLVIAAPDGTIVPLVTNAGAPPPVGSDVWGLAVGDYTLTVDARGNLLIASPDGSLTPFVSIDFPPMRFVGGYRLYESASGDLVVQAPDGTQARLVTNSGSAPLGGVAPALPGDVAIGDYLLRQDSAGDLIIIAPDGSLAPLATNDGAPPTGVTRARGLDVGDYAIFVTVSGSLAIEAPDGTWTVLISAD